MKKSTPLADVEGVLAAATDGQSGLLPALEMIDRELVELALESHARALMYPDSKVQHTRANECRDELLKRLTRASDASKEYVRGLDCQIAKVIPVGHSYSVAIGSLGIKLFESLADAQEVRDAINKAIAGAMSESRPTDEVAAALKLASVVWLHYHNRTDLDPIQQKHLDLAIEVKEQDNES